MALHAPEQDAYTLQDLEAITETDVSSDSASTVSSQTPVSSSRSCCTHRSEQAVKEAENLRIKYEAWSQNELDQSAQQMQEADESTETDSSLASGSESSNDIDPQYLRVRAAPKPTTMTEQDELKQCAEKLAVHLRSRPTLPARYDNPSESFQDVSSGIRLPLYSCPFKNCVFHSDHRIAFLKHLSADEPSSPHRKILRETCGQWLHNMTSLDFVYKAVSILEQKQIPLIGLCTTRRALRQLTTRFNDGRIKSISCFACGQIHTTACGPEHINRGTGESEHYSSIDFRTRIWLNEIEAKHPGTLLNNISFDLWKQRYTLVPPFSDSADTRVPHPPHKNNGSGEYDLSEWTINLPLFDMRTDPHCEFKAVDNVRLFGVTEDIYCLNPAQQHVHDSQCTREPYCQTICSDSVCLCVLNARLA